MAPSTTTSSVMDITTNVRTQARVRVKIGLPVLLLGIAAIWHFGIPYGPNGLVAVGLIAVLHTLYMFTALWLASRIQRPSSARRLVMGTAILDPLMLSGWLSVTGEAGTLFVCFYLFTILGFGFRSGRRAMWTCQITSLIGFAVVLATVPSWRDHPIPGFSLLAVLVVVPIYATTLIKSLRNAQRRAEFESQAKSQLLAKVSHELRTPLSGIVASAQLIAAEALDTHTTKRADIILRLSHDLQLEINDLLDTAKFEAKALVLEPTLFDLNNFMEQIRLTFASTAAAKNIDFTVAVDHGIKSMVQCDAHHLSRTLKNLIGNAVKFTNQGKVGVRLKLLKEENDCYLIRFSVQDTGIGIPQELQQKIFEPFFQVSTGTARQYGGTGLGMSIAKEAVTLMGSEIVVESELGNGSLFYFDINLPVVVKAIEETPQPAQVGPVFGKRVLVADDNATNLILTQELLQKDRHAVFAAGSGQEALDLLSSQDFDVVFLDYNMGDLDGGQVLQLYRFGKLDAAPVFFLTADTTATTTAKLLGIGAAGVLHKPITRDELRHAVAQACRDGNLPVQLSPAPVVPKPPLAPLKFVPPKYLDLSVIEDLQIFSQRPEFLTQILSSATVDIERNCNGLLESLATEDIQKIHEAAHALSGISASVGAVRLASLTRKLMRIDRWQLKTERERWKREISEATQQSLSGIREILVDQSLVH